MNTIAASRPAAKKYVDRSIRVMPNSCDSISLVPKAASVRPAVTPNNPIQAAYFKTSVKMRPRPLPTASRMPNSRVRSLTDCASRP